MGTLSRWLRLVARARALPPDAAARGPVTAAVAALAPLAAAVHLGRAADHLLAPGHRRQPIAAPVFVVGHPRSGTTALHRMLAADRRFATLAAWEALLPSVTLLRLVDRLTAPDTDAGIALGGLRARLDDLIADRLGAVHPTGLSAPEEHDLLFAARADTPWHALPWLADPTGDRWLADAMDDPGHLRWYVGSVRRHLHARGGRWLAKSPAASGWIDGLRAAFPDARFVLVARDPEEAIASHLGLLQQAWTVVDPPRARPGPTLRAAFDLSCALYRHLDAAWDRLPPGAGHVVRFTDLVQRPADALAAVYGAIGWDPDPAALAAARAAPRHHPRPTPALRHLGLTRADLTRGLADAPGAWRRAGRRPP